jgi:hypothetical protein
VAIAFPVLLREYLSRNLRDYGKVRRSGCKKRQFELEGAGKPSRGDLGLCIRIYRCGVGAKRRLYGILNSLLRQRVQVER